MVRGLLVALLIIGLLAVAVLGPRFLMDDDSASASGPQVACNLVTEACEWSTEGHSWKASLVQLNDDQGLHRFRLDIITDGAPQRLLAVLRGESMFLGEYPVVLKPGDRAGHWQADFSPPLCTVQDTMVWRLDLQSPQTPAESVPVRLVFEVQRK